MRKRPDSLISTPLRRFALAAMALLVLGQWLACAAERPQAIAVRYILANVRDITGCQIKTVSADGVRLNGGIFDLSLRRNYWISPVLENMLPLSTEIGAEPKDEEQYAAENNMITVTGAFVSLRTRDLGLSLPSDVFMYSAGTISPGTVGNFWIEAIPREVVDALRNHPLFQNFPDAMAQVLIDIQFEGFVQDGTVVLSSTFTFPVRVCRGCLVFKPAPKTDCTKVPEEILGPCLLGQEEPVDCRICMATLGDPEICIP